MSARIWPGAVLLLALGALACTGTAETGPQPPTILRLSGATARDLRPALDRLGNVGFQVVTEGGSSVTGLQNLQQGTLDVSMTMADVAYLAYAGQLDPASAPFDQLRGMAVVNLNTLHLLVGKGVRASSIRDLTGLRVALGPAGSATVLIAEFLLEAYGIALADVRSTQAPYLETADRLGSGDLDAAFMTQIPPSRAVVAAMTGGARLIDIEGPLVEELRTRYPYLKRTLIPHLTYPDQPKPVRTIGVDLLLVCRADVDDDIVYRLLDAYFGTRPPTGAPTDFERAPATPIPLHPGAARYYRQRELAR